MDPMTWIYLALLATSTAASAKGQQKINTARAKVQAEDTTRRKQQEREAEAAAKSTQDAYFQQRDKTAAREAQLADQFKAAPVAAPTTDSSGTHFLDTAAPTQSTRTIQDTQREMQRGRDRASQRATSMAQLGAFGDVLRENNLTAGRNAQDIGLSASKMQGWTQNVLPALYAKANTAGKDWQGAADIMKLAAAVMSFNALANPATTAKEGADAASTTSGVLDQASGVPSEFAGKDLFGMGRGMSFSAPQSIQEVAPAVGRFTPAFESDLLTYMNDPMWWSKTFPQHWNYYR